MGNSLSCFERVSEHPPYSWPKDHPDRERAIAERKRARHNMKLASKQTRAHTDSEHVQPEAAAPAHPPPQSKELAEPTPAAPALQPADQPPAEQPPAEQPPAEQPPADQPPTEQPPAEQPPAEQPPAEQPPADQPPADQPPADQPRPDSPSAPAAAPAPNAAPDALEHADRAAAASPEREQQLAEPVALPAELATDEQLDDPLSQPKPPTDPEGAHAEAEPVAHPVADEEPRQAPADERPSVAANHAPVLLDDSPLTDVGDAAQAKPLDEARHSDPVDQIFDEQTELITPVVVVDTDDEEDQSDEFKPADQPAQFAPAQEPAEERLDAPKEEPVVDEQREQPPQEVPAEQHSAVGPDGVVKEVKPDVAGSDLPSIESRRAMFDHTEDQLPTPSDVNRDVFDAVSNEYITLEEYRKRQRERAQGLVKECLEKFEEIDEEVSKEKAELAAIVAARNVAQKKTNWAYKQQQDNARTPTKDADSAIRESLTPDVPVSPTTGSVAGISAKFEADGADTPASIGSAPAVHQPEVSLDLSHVDDSVTAGPKQAAGAVGDVTTVKPEMASTTTEKIEAVKESTGGTSGVDDLSGNVGPEVPANVDAVAKQPVGLSETEGNTLEAPHVAGS